MFVFESATIRGLIAVDTLTVCVMIDPDSVGATILTFWVFVFVFTVGDVPEIPAVAEADLVPAL